MSAALVLVDAAGAAAAFVVLLLAANHWRLVLRHGPLADRLLAAPPPPLEANADCPAVLVQIPLFNEAGSVGGAVACAAALDWPADRLTIQILDDSTDDTSALAAAAMRRLPEGGPRFEHLRRGDRGGFKAGALAAGLSRSQAPYVAMLDADFRPPPDWLRRGVALLETDPQAAFAQFRFEPANAGANAATRAQRLLVDAHFVVEQCGRLASGEPIQFNGTAGIWRRAAIDAAGGWTGDTLAEDLDLALRAQLAGWHALLALAPAVPCEAPVQVASWRVQQQRWSTGFMQVARKLVLPVLRARWTLRRRLGTCLLLGVQLALPGTAVATLALLADGALRGFGWPHATLLSGGLAFACATFVAITWPAFRRLHRGGVFGYLEAIAGLPTLLLVMVAGNALGVVSAPFSRERQFVRTPKSGRG